MFHNSSANTLYLMNEWFIAEYNAAAIIKCNIYIYTQVCMWTNTTKYVETRLLFEQCRSCTGS